MGNELTIDGAIMDSWLEPLGGIDPQARRLVIQMVPRGRPRDLLIVEAASALVPDRGWLEDLGENLCHGSPVAAFGTMTAPGELNATRLVLSR